MVDLLEASALVACRPKARKTIKHEKLWPANVKNIINDLLLKDNIWQNLGVPKWGPSSKGATKILNFLTVRARWIKFAV